MKKGILLVVLLGMLLSASALSIRLVRLTIVNKSGLPVEIRLTGEDADTSYYLHVEEGDRQFPAEGVFTIVPGTYQMQPYYIELWDPVYGPSCGETGSSTLYAKRNIKVSILECDRTVRHLGESSQWKWSSTLKYIY